MSRQQQYYKDTVIPKLTEQFGYKTVMQVPRLSKITLNMGLGQAVTDKKLIDNAMADLSKISGQALKLPRPGNPLRTSRFAQVGQLVAW